MTLKIEKLSAIVEQTESDLSKATTENYIVEGQLKSLRKEAERKSLQKTQMEEQLLELLQDQITTDQARQNRTQQFRELQNKRRKMEMLMLSTEQQLSETLFELEKMKGVVTRSKYHAEDLKVGTTTINRNSDNG